MSLADSARGPGCHEQYFGSACHWERFHMLIIINNSCSVICPVFFSSPFLAGGQSGQERMLPWREGEAICIAMSMEGWEGLSLSCWRQGGWLRGIRRQCQPLLWGALHALCWQLGAAGSWSVCTRDVLCCWAFRYPLTSHNDCFKLGALWFSGLCQAGINPLWEAGLPGHKGFSYLG